MWSAMKQLPSKERLSLNVTAPVPSSDLVEEQNHGHMIPSELELTRDAICSQPFHHSSRHIFKYSHLLYLFEVTNRHHM
ncbi:unnamed protein product [Lathyrus sativus]|nr:unnamed protein product [Lathyrus sativus]